MDNTNLERIKNELDIVDVISEYIDLSKKGKNFWALCPFHEDSNPSMSISPDKQLFKCFVCGAGGDIVKFVSEYEKISFLNAMAKLGLKIGLDIKVNNNDKPRYSEKDKEMIKVMNDAMEYFQYSLMTEEGTNALKYTEERNLSVKIMEEFLIGFAPNEGLQLFLERKGYDKALIINAGLVNQSGKDFFRNRLIFGITNKYGDVVAFSARDLSGKSNAKYINSPETVLFSKSSTLYNYHNAKEAIRKNKEIFINEGFMDVIAMSKAGIRNSIAIMGTALTKEHISYLLGKKVILMLDSDKAGVNATIKSIKILLEAGIKTFVVSNEDSKDPDELFNAVGVEGLREIVEKQIDALEFIFKLHEKQFAEKTPSTIQKFIKSFLVYLNNTDDITKDFYINKLVNTLGISKDIILNMIPLKKQPDSKPKNIAPIPPRDIAPIPPRDITPIPPRDITPIPPRDIKGQRNQVMPRNYSYSLIYSMIKKPFLINQYKENDVTISDPVLLAIANYLVLLNDGIKKDIPREIKLKFKELEAYGKFVNTSDEFLDLIKRVNNEAKEKALSAFNVKLSNTSDQRERIEILNEIAKLKRRK